MALDAASSSSSRQILPNKYDVFISFRGEDTRSNFTSHLYDAFCRKQIITYIDYQLAKGDEISPALMQAIKDSSMSVVVFSENYASSRWCLEELAHILHCKRAQGQLVVPVFFKVEPSHVRNQTGPYEEAFKKHERDLKVNQHKMQIWKQALAEAANLAGWDSHTFRDEAALIQKTVEDILQKLNVKYPPAELKGLVGIDDNCTEIESLLRDVDTIGIWGMGGIGKSTIARTIFVKCSSLYEGSCFLENIRENSENRLAELRHKFLSCLLKDDDYFIGTSTTFVESRLSRMKVFIVLDDISTLEQFEYLVGEPHCFCPGSKVLITTRDKHVLSKGVDVIHKVKELDFHQSLKLFSWNAFNTDLPITGYEELSKRAVDYAKGVPLALKVLGSFLRGKSEIEWISALKKLEKIPHENIQRVLRLSYDGLNRVEKKIFLDIACFLKGAMKEFVISLLDSYGFYGAIGLRTLHDKALINVDGEYVEMHDLIQEMGLEIVREESIDERSRLCDPEEIYDVLANNMGTNKVEGIKLDVSRVRDLHMEADIFKKMPNIRFLNFYSSSNDGSSHVHLPKGLKFLPNKMGYLSWYGFPLKSLPSTFCPEKLVKLLMPNSQLQKLWNGVQDFVNLEEINLVNSKQLKELPDFSKCLNLKVVILACCERLCDVHPSILSLHSLVTLDLSWCTKLKRLKSEFHFKSLQYIGAAFCSNLKEFSVSSDEMRELDLVQTGIEILHPSIGSLSKLERLKLSSSRLVDLPDQLSCLRSLTVLGLYDCQVLDDLKLHILFDGKLSLREVTLENCCNITELPNNTEYLSGLKCLVIVNCRRLRSLPKLPPSFIKLDVYNCRSLETVSTFRPLNGDQNYISFTDCMQLNEQSLHNIMEAAYSMVYYALPESKNHISRSMICVPAGRVPEWFRYRAAENYVIAELPQISDLQGFFLCTVLEIHSKIGYPFDTESSCYLDGWEVLADSGLSLPIRKMKYDHVIIWKDAKFYEKAMQEIRRGNQKLLSDIKLIFDFSAEPLLEPNSLNSIKECGVCPVYVSECQEFISQMEMERNNKMPLDVEDQQQQQQPLQDVEGLRNPFLETLSTFLFKFCLCSS